nr:PH domain-containing protein [Streptomyces sp. WAC 06783]
MAQRTSARWRRRHHGSLELCCTLPSQFPGYPFEAHLTGAWQHLPARHPHQHPQAAATDYALTVAQDVAGTTHLSWAALAEARINSRLGRPVDLPHIPVRLLWARIQLTADPQQAADADLLLRDQHRAEHHARQDRHRLQRALDLRDALLTDPSLAFAYWFLDHPETIDKETVNRVECLVTAAASYAPRSTWVQVAQILQEFVHALPDDARQHLITSFAHILERYGQHERAQQMRTAGLTPPPEPPSATGRTGST